MATLEIDLNCMCLLVPDPKPGIVHVLMPCTHHAAANDMHIVRLDYTAKNGGNNVVRRLEGWVLELGDRNNPDASLDAGLPTEADSPQIVNLTQRTGDRVPSSMLEHDEDVISRITFYGGQVASVEGQDPEWLLEEDRVFLAHKLTWRLPITHDQVVWSPLGRGHDGGGCREDAGHNGSTPREALPSLGDIEPNQVGNDTVYRLHLHHVAANAVVEASNGPPLTNALDERAIQNHFRMFYTLLGTSPHKVQVPMLPPEIRAEVEDPEGAGTPGWACKLGRAEAELTN